MVTPLPVAVDSRAGGDARPFLDLMPMTATASAHATPTVESEVARIRALVKERRFAEGVAAATALRGAVPENRDVLYLLALGQRQLTRTADALETLEQLERFHPGYSRLYQERGHCYVAMKDAPQAIEAFLRAVAINPALPASWGMLEGLYRMCGDADNAGRAAAHVAKLKTLPQEVITATGLFSDGDLAAAEKMIRAFLLAHGDHIEAMRLLARIGVAREVFDDAEVLLEAVLERVPGLRRRPLRLRLGAARAAQAQRSPGRARQVAGSRSGQSPVPDAVRNRHRGPRRPRPGDHALSRSCCAMRRRDRPMPPNCTCRSRIR